MLSGNGSPPLVLLGLSLALVMVSGCRASETLTPTVTPTVQPTPTVTVAPTPTATIVICVTEGTYKTPAVSDQLRRALADEYRLTVLAVDSSGLYICPPVTPDYVSSLAHHFYVTLRVDDVHDSAELNRQLALVGEIVMQIMPFELSPDRPSLGGYWLNVTFTQFPSESGETWERSIQCSLYEMETCLFQ